MTRATGPAGATGAADLPATADLVVVGGGVVGAATAYYAGRAGLATVLIERRPALGTLSTAAASGAFRLQFDNPEELALVRESVDLYRRFAEVGLPGWDLDLRTQGYLWATTTEEGARRQREKVARQRAWGLADVQILSGRELRTRFPYLAPEAVQARYRAGDGWLDARKLTIGFARGSGAAIVLRTEVTALEREAGRVTGVRTPRGRVSAGAVVVAAGNFTLGC